MREVVALKQIAGSLTELWSPRVVGEIDDAYVKVAKVQGSLAWHSHEGEDEMFLVLKGRLRIEKKTTLHTGDVVTEKTRSISEQMRPV